MKLQCFSEIRHSNDQTAAILFETPAEETYREVVRRAQLESERLGVRLLQLLILNIWSVAEIAPLRLEKAETH